MTPQQTKRHRELDDTLARLHEQRDAIITKLVRIEGKLRDHLRAKNRLEKAMAKVSPIPVSVAEGKLLPPIEPKPAAPFDDAIPPFLQRKKREAKAADKLAAMPLTGKAALEAIRQR